jgi:pSer/pThr/pTyr-binding forkhead associated (FHA) protein
MARLLIQTAGLGRELIELKLGSNVIGRSPDSDFPLSHPTISTIHCELVLSDAGVILRDLDSTNGTFVNGNPVHEVALSAGQTVRLGDVELLVETTEIKVAIPKFANLDLPAPPVVSKEGAMICPRHHHAPVSYQCTACKEVMCGTCVHSLRRKGSRNLLLLCPICSAPVKLIGEPEKPKKRSIFSRVGETVRMKLTRTLRIQK